MSASTKRALALAMSMVLAPPSRQKFITSFSSGSSWMPEPVLAAGLNLSSPTSIAVPGRQKANFNRLSSLR